MEVFSLLSLKLLLLQYIYRIIIKQQKKNCLVEPPSFAVWKVTTDIDGINIHYEVEDKRPNVFNIKWTRNGKLLDFENTNYAGGSLEDKILRIASPTVADRAKYCCTITNAVGSASMDITLGNFQFSSKIIFDHFSIYMILKI